MLLNLRRSEWQTGRAGRGPGKPGAGWDRLCKLELHVLPTVGQPWSYIWSYISVGHRICAGGPSEAAGPSRALGAGGRPASSRAALPREHRSSQEMWKRRIHIKVSLVHQPQMYLCTHLEILWYCLLFFLFVSISSVETKIIWRRRTW